MCSKFYPRYKAFRSIAITFYGPSKPGLHNSLQCKGHNNADLLSRAAHRYGKTSCDRGKVKKQPLRLYLHAKTSNCCFSMLIGRKNLSLLFHSIFIKVVTVIGYFLTIVTFSRQGQIVTNIIKM